MRIIRLNCWQFTIRVMVIFAAGSGRFGGGYGGDGKSGDHTRRMAPIGLGQLAADSDEGRLPAAADHPPGNQRTVDQSHVRRGPRFASSTCDMWCRSRAPDGETPSLPLVHNAWHGYQDVWRQHKNIFLVARDGIEPPTRGFSVPVTTPAWRAACLWRTRDHSSSGRS